MSDVCHHSQNPATGSQSVKLRATLVLTAGVNKDIKLWEPKIQSYKLKEETRKVTH